MEKNQCINDSYIVGEEKALKELIGKTEIMPLLQCAVSAGALHARIEAADGDILYQYGNLPVEDRFIFKRPIHIEGEISGYIVISGDGENEPIVKALGELIFNAVKIIIQSSFRALLATETHKTVVHQSYEELLETNNKLKFSENRYRELANSLEKQVYERTEELKKAHAKLLQQEKIASIGQLAAGIAHEINNPLGFISSNINTLKQYVSKFKEMLVYYRDVLDKRIPTDDDREIARQKWERLKLDFIFPDVDDLINESLSGAERVKRIVSDLKGFSHIDEANKADININTEIDRTLNVLTHEIPDDAEIIKDYHDLPAFTCNPAHICQAFFNIIQNALQAQDRGLKLVITTQHTDSLIKITFSDNGPGIPEDIKNRIFEPFFTTKEVGKGTGMGLNVAYEIITSYGGTVEVESESGKGATFSILLPLPPEGQNV